jgi:hypothetical protein
MAGHRADPAPARPQHEGGTVHSLSVIRSILRRRLTCICGEHWPCVRSRYQPYKPLSSDVRVLNNGPDSW